MSDSEFAAPLRQVNRVYVQVGRRKLLYFGGCDYHRLSSQSQIVHTIHATLDSEGLTSAASRKTTGNHQLFERVEHAAAKHFGSERAVLLSSGYLANIAVAQGLGGGVDQALVDERCHGSLVDALRFIECPVTEFAHRSALALQEKIAPFRSSRTLVVTDGMFAFDGSLAPLRAYRNAIGPKPFLWVDDAHAAGVLGARGLGSVEAAGIARRNMIQTITFSKAFGVYGGAILCDEDFRNAVVAKSSAITGNTPLPLPIAAGILKSLTLLKSSYFKKLRGNIRGFWRALGQEPESDQGPIIAVASSGALSRELEEAGIYPTLIRYPGGPAEGYFRFALSSAHTTEQVVRLADAIRRAGGRMLSPLTSR